MPPLKHLGLSQTLGDTMGETGISWENAPLFDENAGRFQYSQHSFLVRFTRLQFDPRVIEVKSKRWGTIPLLPAKTMQVAANPRLSRGDGIRKRQRAHPVKSS